MHVRSSSVSIYEKLTGIARAPHPTLPASNFCKIKGKGDAMLSVKPASAIANMSREKYSRSFTAKLFGQMRATRALVAIIPAFVCAALLPAAAQDRSADAPATDSVQGTVVNAVTGEGIGRALVYSPDNRYAALTDGQGHFQFTLPESQQFSLPENMNFSTGPGGMVITTRPIVLLARRPGFIEEPEPQFELSPGKDIVIRLLPEAIIQGRILLSDSDAAAGITVELFMKQVQEGRPRWIRSQSVRTNSAGEFRFAELRPGAYKVMTRELLDTDPVDLAPKAQLYGFPPASFAGVNDFASGQTIQLAAGQTFQADIALKRQPYFQVRIPVSDSADSPGMNVVVLAEGHPGPGYALGYDPNAQRIVGTLPRGNYRVESTSYGQQPAGGAVNLTVTGKTPDGPTLTMLPAAQIPVNVREEFTSDFNGTTSVTTPGGGRSFTFYQGPRSQLNLWLEPVDDFGNRGGGSPRPPRSAQDDQLVIEGAQPGQYWVRVEPFRGYVASATSGTTDLLHEPLTVSPGANTQINVTLRDDVAHLQGTVSGIPGDSSSSRENSSAQGTRKNGAYIYCVPLPDRSGQYAEFWADSSGQFDFTELAPGTYRLLAFPRRQPSLPYRDAEAMRAYDSLGTVVQLSPGQTQQVQLQLIPEDNGQ